MNTKTHKQYIKDILACKDKSIAQALVHQIYMEGQKDLYDKHTLTVRRMEKEHVTPTRMKPVL
jgi:hypothetical protein